MWSRFRADERGGAAPIFALALVPMIGLVGAAVDYSRSTRPR
jgi:Flp pilus assembly protein TadG